MESKTKYNLFVVRPVQFEEGQEDPFKFASLSEREADKYIPFSGVIRKPIYLLFVAYVNWLIEHKVIAAKSYREAESFRLRLEKLLVYSWKSKHESLRGRNVLGNSIRRLDPFDGTRGSWVVLNAFKVYKSSARKLVSERVLEKYDRKFKKHVPPLMSFLQRNGSLERDRRFMEEILREVSGGESMFNGELILAQGFRRSMLKQLQYVLKEESNLDPSDQSKLFRNPRGSKKLLEKLLTQSEHYPFRNINRWFGAFVRACDAEIRNQSSEILWRRADTLFEGVKESGSISRRPDPRCWFRYEAQRYVKDSDFNESGWSALVQRAEREQNSGVFYDFRVPALSSLLTELDSHAT